MIATKTGSNAGPIAGFIAHANLNSPYIRLITYRKNLLTPAVLSNQPNLDLGWLATAGFEFSNNANFLVAGAANNVANSLRVYSRSGTIFTALTVPNWTSSNVAYSVSITPSGEYISTTNRIYHNNAGSLTSLSRPSGLSAEKNALSPNGLFLATINTSSPYGIQILKRSGSGNSASFANHQLISFGNGPFNRYPAFQFSKSGDYLAASTIDATRLLIYKYNSSTDQFDALNQPPTGGIQPDATIEHIAWAFDDSFVAASTTSKAFLYERSGDSFTHRITITNSFNYSGGFHPSGNFFITGNGNIYRKITASNWQYMSSVNWNPTSPGVPSTYPAFGSTFSPLITL
jgi:hypothetical protein